MKNKSKLHDKAYPHLNSMALFSQRLPPELWINIVSYLYIPDIHALQGVSKLFDTLIRLNESPIYRGAATRHGFASHAVSDIQAVIATRKCRFDWLSGVRTWLHYCVFAVVNTFHLFIDAPRQTTCGHSKELVCERPFCPLRSLGLCCSSASNQDRRR